MRRLALAVLASVAATVPWGVRQAVRAAPGQSQQPDTSFRTEVDFVNVDVTVTDRQGRVVPDLRADEFEVFEDGKRQQVSAFSLVQVPIARRRSAAAPEKRPELEPDVRTNDPASGGRVYVLMLDDLHVAPLRSSPVKAAARLFIEEYLGPNDLAAVVHTSGRADASQDFTTSPRLLLQAVDRFLGRKLRSRVLEQLDAYDLRPDEPTNADMRMRRIPDPLAVMRADHARSMLATLSAVGDLLARAPGQRKAVLLFSEGLDYDIQMGGAQTSSGLNTFTNMDAPALRHQLQAAIRASARANVSIYAVDPRGLAGTGDELIEVTSLPINPLLGLTTTAFEDELRVARDSLRVLSEQTGGVATVESNDFRGAFEQLVAESSIYYLLGYRSSNPRRDGSFRSIDVRVTRQGVRVRARPGYFAVPPDTRAGSGLLTEAVEPSQPLREALNSPLPVAGLPVRTFAAPFRGDKDASVLVGVEVEAKQFRFEQKDGVFVDTLEVAIVALDEDGKFKTGDRHTIALRLQPATHAALRAHGLRLLFRLNLPPGRWRLRAAAHESGAGVTGSVFHDLDVPDFHEMPLAMSGLVLTTSRAAEMPTARPDPRLDGVLPSPPTGIRRFRPGETAIAHFEVYGGALSRAGRASVVLTVRTPDGQVLARSENRADGEIADASRIALPVPFAGLDPGRYVLLVEVRALGPDRMVSREIPFEIVASGQF